MNIGTKMRIAENVNANSLLLRARLLRPCNFFSIFCLSDIINHGLGYKIATYEIYMQITHIH